MSLFPLAVLNPSQISPRPPSPPPHTHTHTHTHTFCQFPTLRVYNLQLIPQFWRNTGTVIPHLIWKAILYPPIAFPLRHQSKWSPPEIKDYISTKLSGGDRYNSKRLFFTISIVQQSLTNWTLSIISVKCLYFILNNKLIVFSKN